ncbi:NAD-dependent epimerase [Paenibacillus antri]|uniref:NAD-dependent epimerase n=1 Tax=Paenibacillus antri TaxID=2582848 RepID=A0A5R9FYP3_9BACL|nr:NAD-dependent epimerase [Paenibacillus antri]TLS49172.1 NAD-dependent epimerase [Paenibacillus antri]
METVLITGAAGFIGYHTAERLLREGVRVIGIDDLNDYYDVGLKRSRLERLGATDRFSFVEGSFADKEVVDRLFQDDAFDYVVHLGAQAGVRYSLERPDKYVASNLVGFANMLEACRHRGVKHLVYASSSSVYGANVTMPFRTTDPVDHPVSLYAATKKSNELMAHTYSHLFGLPTTGLRFFTVYGPWGRPDMAYFSFTRDILAGKTIRLFNHGDMRRDFTYVDDIVEGVVRVMRRVPAPNPTWDREHPNPSGSYAPYKVYNIGNNEPVALGEFVATLEELLGVKAVVEYAPMQPGDVYATYADISELERDVGFRPSTPLREGLRRFVEWYRGYYENK